MVKRQRDHDAGGGSQQKHACALGMTAVALFATCIPASAEVCDKVVGESWSREHGVAWLLNPTTEQVRSYLISVVMIAVALAMKKPLISYIVAGLIALLAIFAMDNFSDGVFIAAVNEGCQSIRTSFADAAFFVTLSVLCIWTGRRFARQRVST